MKYNKHSLIKNEENVTFAIKKWHNNVRVNVFKILHAEFKPSVHYIQNVIF